MPVTEVGLLAALAAGVLVLLSPCSALLLPSFFAYAFGSTGALLSRTMSFYVGLLVTLVPLGIGVSAASRLFYGHRSVLIAVAGWTIIALGAWQLLGRGFSIPFMSGLQSRLAARNGSSHVATFALGAVYGLAGFCSGPVLGAILAMAATQPSAWYGGLLLAVYALGMAVPLLILAALWDRFELGHRRWLRGRTWTVGPLRLHSTSVASGLMFIAIGVLFLRFDGTAGVTGVLGFGDTTDLEVTAQRAVTDLAAAVPPWLVPAMVLLVSAAVAWRRIEAGRPVDGGSDGEDRAEMTPSSRQAVPSDRQGDRDDVRTHRRG